MELNTVWFILISVLFTGFFILEGFDFGVGMLLPFLGKKDIERRAIINTIGPVWDGNEVWMITAGGALFASFPHVYATLFSGFYLPLVFMLVALILRGVGLEFRGKRDDPKWRSFWDWSVFTGSLLPALLWGVTVGNLVQGISIEADMNYYGGLLPLLNPFALLSGIVFVCIFLLHGANFLELKAPVEIGKRVRGWMPGLWVTVLLVTIAFLAWTFFGTDLLTKPGINGIFPAILSIISLVLTGWLIRIKRSGWAFAAGSLAIVAITVMVFTGLYPRILISTLDPNFNLTISNASASPYTLKIMTIVAAIFLPFVLAYQAWSYWIFRKRIEAKPEKLVY